VEQTGTAVSVRTSEGTTAGTVTGRDLFVIETFEDEGTVHQGFVHLVVTESGTGISGVHYWEEDGPYGWSAEYAEISGGRLSAEPAEHDLTGGWWIIDTVTPSSRAAGYPPIPEMEILQMDAVHDGNLLECTVTPTDPADPSFDIWGFTDGSFLTIVQVEHEDMERRETTVSALVSEDGASFGGTRTTVTTPYDTGVPFTQTAAIEGVRDAAPLVDLTGTWDLTVTAQRTFGPETTYTQQLVLSQTGGEVPIDMDLGVMTAHVSGYRLVGGAVGQEAEYTFEFYLEAAVDPSGDGFAGSAYGEVETLAADWMAQYATVTGARVAP
jgi:hypothetical protein